MTYNPLRFITSEYIEYLERDIHRRVWLQHRDTQEDLYLEIAKRGNEAYAKRVRKKLNMSDEFFDELEECYPTNKNHNQLSTHTLFITLTYAHDISRTQAWEQIGHDWNLFITKIKNTIRFGDVSYIRVFESTTAGYPHIHALLFFTLPFQNLHYKTRKKNHRKQYLALNILDLQYFQSKWKYFICAEGVISPAGAWRYITKYITKAVDMKSRKDVLTNALVWWFRRRAYSLSRALINLILLETNSNSNFAWMGIVEYADLLSTLTYYNSINYHSKPS